MKSLLIDKYHCANCKETFDIPPQSEWSEEDREKEYKSNFGFEYKPKEADVLCDDCYNEFMQWFEEISPEEHLEINAANNKQ